MSSPLDTMRHRSVLARVSHLSSHLSRHAQEKRCGLTEGSTSTPLANLYSMVLRISLASNSQALQAEMSDALCHSSRNGALWPICSGAVNDRGCSCRTCLNILLEFSILRGLHSKTALLTSTKHSLVTCQPQITFVLLPIFSYFSSLRNRSLL